jgi:hypothetical protein
MMMIEGLDKSFGVCVTFSEEFGKFGSIQQANQN